MASKPPTKPKRRRSASRSHAECSSKRTLLKQRIRDLKTELDECIQEARLARLQVDILHDVVATIVGTMGLEGVLDPFGAGLTPAKEEGKSNDNPPT